MVKRMPIVRLLILGRTRIVESVIFIFPLLIVVRDSARLIQLATAVEIHPHAIIEAATSSLFDIVDGSLIIVSLLL